MLMVKNQLLSLKAYNPGPSTDDIKRRYELTNVIRLDANENPYGCSPKVFETITQFQKDVSCYPDGDASDLRYALADHHEIHPDSLLFGNGLDEVIQIISRAVLSPGANIVMANPTFSQYRLHAVIEGANIREVPTNDGCHDLGKMLLQVDKETKIVWICNPNNPTGTYINNDDLVAFLREVPEETLVIVDEAYADYVSASDYPDTFSLMNTFKNLIILRTFSKAYGLAGFRIGYAIGHPELIKQIEVTRLPFNINFLGQIAALTALSETDFLESCVNQNRDVMEALSEFLHQNNVSYYPSQTNFLFLKAASPNDFYEALLERGVVVRPFPTGVRMTLPKWDDLELIKKHIKTIQQKDTRHLMSS